jgi:hypothetical protein
MNKPRQVPRDYVVGSPDLYDSDFQYSVYVLYCPVGKRIRYVGQTRFALYWRLALHRQEATAHGFSEKQKWLRSLRALGTMPLIRKVAKFKTRGEAKAYETQLIKALWPRCPLLNKEGTPIDTRLKVNKQAIESARFYGLQQA